MNQLVSYILWHNSSTGETEFWYMDKHRLVRRGTLLEENGTAAHVDPPFSIAGTGDFDGNGISDILWCDNSTGEMQIWYMDDHWLADRRTVLADDGKVISMDPPFNIAGIGDFNGDGVSDILVCNSASGEMQVWYMDGHRLADRKTVVDEDGTAIFADPPSSVVGAADFSGDGRADILCYEDSTGETQIWYMDGHRLLRRSTVTRDNGNAVFVCSPYNIVAVADFDGNGCADIVWYDGFTGQAEVWYMNRNSVLGRGTVLGLDATIAFMGPPLSIVGAGTSLVSETLLARQAANARGHRSGRAWGSAFALA